jgi:3-hydroxyacyl-CoA dehydrogenase
MSISTTIVPENAAEQAFQVTLSRPIRRVGVIGAGIMGSRIALHFANIGVPTVLLDRVPEELTAEEVAKGLSLEHPAIRNRIVRESFNAAVEAKPSPVYAKRYIERVRLGNLQDDFQLLADCDWIIEVVIERLDVKKALFDRLEQVRKPGSLITTNTSGIPIHLMSEGRSADFQAHFCGTHFFNPPRYLPLLEIIPGPATDPTVIDFLMDYGSHFLGKKTVLCKDTPAFIANRIGIYAICDLFHLVEKYKLTVEETDALTGPLIGHPKSATFRTCDVVGLETAIKVAQGIQQTCPTDERIAVFNVPDYIQYMVDNKMWGEKTGQGFYKRSKGPDGETQIHSLKLDTKTYGPQEKVKSPLLEQLKLVEGLEQQFKALVNGQENYATFIRESTYGLLAYASNRIPEIADELYRLDAAICAGFGWEIGPFEQWDILGLVESLPKIEAAGFQVASWVREMVQAGLSTFYTVRNGKRYFYDLTTRDYLPIPGAAGTIVLEYLSPSQTVWSNSGVQLTHIGDGVLNLAFKTKANTLGGDVLSGILAAIDIAEKGYSGLVIGNQGEHFSLGANLGLVLMLAIEQEWEELDMAVRLFQRVTSRVRYSSIPVVVAPHGMTLGGGCELVLHADAVVAAAESYIGLVEVGVGLIPAGGGTKEMVIRMSEAYRKGDVETNIFTETFLALAQAKTSTSATEAFDIGYLQKNRDRIVVNPDLLITEAKHTVLALAEAGYVMPIPRKDIRVLGQLGLGLVYTGAFQMEYAGYATAYDRHVAEELGFVLAGADLSSPTLVTESYLLDLEREAFLRLCGQKKTLERIQHTLKTGKPLRN